MSNSQSTIARRGRPPSGPRRKKDGRTWYVRIKGKEVKAPATVETADQAWLWYRSELDRAGLPEPFRPTIERRMTLNLGADEVAAVEQIVDTLERKTPGLKMDEATAVRWAIRKAAEGRDDRITG